MTKEFKNLLDLLRSDNPDNVYLALVLAQNFKEEFEKYIKCSLEDYEELYHFLVEYKPKGLLTGTKYINTYLGVVQKRITTLPKSIRILKKLLNLDLERNLISELPAEIGELRNLRLLNLSTNPLEKLPKEIEKLERLQNIQLVDTNFKVFPQELATIKNLKYLYLSENDLQKFAKEIKELKEKKPLLCVEVDLPF